MKLAPNLLKAFQFHRRDQTSKRLYIFKHLHIPLKKKQPQNKNQNLPQQTSWYKLFDISLARCSTLRQITWWKAMTLLQWLSLLLASWGDRIGTKQTNIQNLNTNRKNLCSVLQISSVCVNQVVLYNVVVEDDSSTT